MEAMAGVPDVAAEDDFVANIIGGVLIGSGDSVGAQEARAHLEGMRLPGKGFVTRQWTASGMLATLKFASDLKPGSDLRSTLVVASGVLF